MAYAKFNGIEIPAVYDVQMKTVYSGDSARTAGGKLRRDSVAVKRRWEIKCRPVPKEKIDPLLNYLESTLYAEGAFWLYEFGSESNTVRAMVDPESISVKVVGIPDEHGNWHKDGKELSLAIEEV